MIKCREYEIESWLVNYVNKNEDIEDTLHQLLVDFRDYESTLFDIKVGEEITISPMKYYIENRLKWYLIKITKEVQIEAVGIDHVTATKETTKGPSTSR